MLNRRSFNIYTFFLLNEKYTDCAQRLCRPQNCSDVAVDQLSFICEPDKTDGCDVGCVCIDGYLRADNGTCVPEEECPSTNPAIICAQNEEYSLCTQILCRRQFCDEIYGSPVHTCSLEESESCNPGCVCKEGYLRDDKDICVLEDECKTPFDCSARPNEIYVACPSCVSDSCADIGKTRDSCSRWSLIEPCKPACRCATGFNRNDEGVCVPTAQCPGICPKNQKYTDCAQRLCRPQNCSDVADDQLSFICEPDKTDGCDVGCVCIDGFLRADNGTCVPEEECPSINPAIICAQNEEYSLCTQVLCRPQFCDEIYGSPVHNCSLEESESCNPGCVCKEGYLRDDNGICVLEEECKRKSPCPEHETEVLCKNACSESVCPREGSESYACLDVCLGPGCACERNYSRASNGTCIPTIDCPPFDCSARPNEIYVACPSCVSDSCEDIGKTRDSCSRWALIEPCTPTCRCAPGFNRNDEDLCVPTTQCHDSVGLRSKRYAAAVEGNMKMPEKKCLRPHEFYDCGSACDNVCSNLHLQNRTNCPIKNIVCNPGCYCRDGYARDETGNCVPVDKCNNPALRAKRATQKDLFPVKECNGPNEFFQCGPACDNVCATLDKQNRTHCPLVNVMCNSRCYCNDGYARDDRGICIPVEQCRKPASDSNKPEGHCTGPNEIYTCQKSCPPGLCFSLVARFKCDATEECKPQCACKPGYLRVHEKSACVPICECPEMRNSPDCHKM
ncbi:zonadhesin isoform X3 [Manduca sexta]|uniref:zonadhesin isoform X3 n=1 Tax=Manduca sexta TaxID=7130 RepID=UPI00189013B2|nr:zonadhesin isoform X3 [Manduca sexta]